jgi:hypothetical protein
VIELPQPHWKIATMTPKAAPIESIFIAAALSGMNRDLKTNIKSIKLKRMTAPIKTGSLLLRALAKSLDVAVEPPT